MYSIVNLESRHEPLFTSCLEDRLPEAKEAGDHRARWIRHMKEHGLGVKLAVDEKDILIGMIQYVPAAQTLLEGGDGCCFIQCIWVVNFADDRGNHQRHGLGTRLLEAAEEDARARGATGMAAWGLVIPVWMKASWFRGHGYRRVDRSGVAGLMWKPFVDGVTTPRFVRPKKKPARVPGQVTVTSFLHGACRAGNVAHERARRACEEIGAPVVYRVVDTLDMETAREWGILDGLYVDDREIRTGPPPSYASIRQVIDRSARRVTAHGNRA